MSSGSHPDALRMKRENAMLDASVIVHQLGDVRISEGDQFLLYLRNLPSKVQEFLQVHRNAVTVQLFFLSDGCIKHHGLNQPLNFSNQSLKPDNSFPLEVRKISILALA